MGAFRIDEFVHEHLGDERPLHPVPGEAVLLPGFHPLRVRFPEVPGEREFAAIEEVRVVDCLIVEIVFSGETDRRGLDPHIDVFRDEDHDVVLEDRGDAKHRRENRVVAGPGLQIRGEREFDIQASGLEVELSLRLAVSEGGKRKAF